MLVLVDVFSLWRIGVLDGDVFLFVRALLTSRRNMIRESYATIVIAATGNDS